MDGQMDSGKRRRGVFSYLLVLIPIAGSFLYGCSVGPDYQQPAVETPKRFQYAGETPPAEPGIFKDGWWRIFDDVLLNQLVEEAEQGNFDLVAAVERVKQARAVSRVSRASLFPFFNVSPAFERRDYSENIDGSSGNTVSTYAFPFNLAYEIDIFGRVRRDYEAARADAEAVEADLAAVRLILQSDVALNYFALRSLDEEIRIVSRILEIREEELKLMNRRYETGVVSRLPLAQAKAELNATRALLFALNRERAQLQNAIIVLLGKAPSEMSLQPDPLREAPPKIPTVIPSSLLTARPDIRRVERTMAAESARIGVATSEFYPRITLSADAGWASSGADDLFDSRSFTWGIGPAVRLPLFEGGRNVANLERAKARFAEVYANYRQTIIRAFGEVEDSLVGADLLEKQESANDLAIESAEQAYDLSKKRFDGGLTDYLSVLDAERTYLDNLRLGSQIRGQRYASAVNLIKSIGGRW